MQTMLPIHARGGGGDNDEDPEAARRRIAAEMAKIQHETEVARKQKMKALIGDEAESAHDRQKAVIHAQHEYETKGTHPDEKAKPDLVELLPVVQDQHNLEKRKEEYRNHLEAVQIKGREHLLLDEDGNIMMHPYSPSLSPAFVVAGAHGSGGSGSSSTSPRKVYLALAEQNAMTSSIGAPSLYVYDSGEAAQRAKQTATVNALTPRGWDGVTHYTLVELRQRRVPKDIDWKNREQYLSPDEFASAFDGMTKDEFAVQPKWKRDKMKQKLYLF